MKKCKICSGGMYIPPLLAYAVAVKDMRFCFYCGRRLKRKEVYTIYDLFRKGFPKKKEGKK